MKLHSKRVTLRIGHVCPCDFIESVFRARVQECSQTRRPRWEKKRIRRELTEVECRRAGKFQSIQTMPNHRSVGQIISEEEKNRNKDRVAVIYSFFRSPPSLGSRFTSYRDFLSYYCSINVNISFLKSTNFTNAGAKPHKHVPTSSIQVVYKIYISFVFIRKKKKTRYRPVQVYRPCIFFNYPIFIRFTSAINQS